MQPSTVKLHIARARRIIESATPLALPRYAKDGDAGLDLPVDLTQVPGYEVDGDGRMYINVKPGERVMLPSGWKFLIPRGHEGQVRSRSGLAFKHSVRLFHTSGTIDSGFRGEVKAILENLGSEVLVIHHGDYCAQLVIAPVTEAIVEEVETLVESERGESGLGSTGMSQTISMGPLFDAGDGAPNDPIFQAILDISDMTNPAIAESVLCAAIIKATEALTRAGKGAPLREGPKGERLTLRDAAQRLHATLHAQDRKQPLLPFEKLSGMRQQMWLEVAVAAWAMYSPGRVDGEYCLYCGTSYPLGTSGFTLRSHVADCAEHPLNKGRKEADELRARVTVLEADLARTTRERDAFALDASHLEDDLIKVGRFISGRGPQVMTTTKGADVMGEAKKRLAAFVHDFATFDIAVKTCLSSETGRDPTRTTTEAQQALGKVLDVIRGRGENWHDLHADMEAVTRCLREGKKPHIGRAPTSGTAAAMFTAIEKLIQDAAHASGRVTMYEHDLEELAKEQPDPETWSLKALPVYDRMRMLMDKLRDCESRFTWHRNDLTSILNLCEGDKTISTQTELGQTIMRMLLKRISDHERAEKDGTHYRNAHETIVATHNLLRDDLQHLEDLLRLTVKPGDVRLFSPDGLRIYPLVLDLSIRAGLIKEAK